MKFTYRVWLIGNIYFKQGLFFYLEFALPIQRLLEVTKNHLEKYRYAVSYILKSYAQCIFNFFNLVVQFYIKYI